MVGASQRTSVEFITVAAAEMLPLYTQRREGSASKAAPCTDIDMGLLAGPVEGNIRLTVGVG